MGLCGNLAAKVICSGALLSTVLWVLTTVLPKRTKNGAKPGIQRGCHNFYWQGVLSHHRLMSTKPFLIALTLIHKLQDIFRGQPEGGLGDFEKKYPTSACT